MSENEIKPVAFDGSELRHGCVQRPKRWSGDTHDDLGGSVDEAATDALMAAAADAIDRLTAERDAAVAERDAVRNAIGNDMLKSYIEKHGDPVPLVLELEEAQRKLSVAVANGNALVAALDRIVSLKMSMFKDPYDMIGECVNIAADAIDAARAEGGV